ncbi:CaiB/BaiF CoA transferase family protein [Sphingobium sp. TCM1]|uniref:CaiB/BaiF CoA transferase family protein n=1 Tax=Sphingobium sp. TCM1 TaxID=453246 RepID=UPI0018DC24A5|nr:CaiB/BaiF CoA-transferase family protein [Sphingobium sp. TCM1]
MAGPLSGVRLVEMDAIGPVPLAGMLLSGLGADIVRVGRPGQGAWADVGAAVLHRGRSHVALDLKQAADRDRLLDLLDHADGLIEGSRPGVMERLGLCPDVCLARNPRLVYGRVTGWGQTGPLAQAAGHDINYIALTGALHAMGDKGGRPFVPLNLVGDYAGGTMFLALGMVSAILSARATGIGQVVDAAMVDGVANLMSLFQAFLSTGQWRDERGVNLLDGSAPFYRCYACADGGYVAVGALEPQFFAKLLAGLDLDPADFVQNEKACWPEMERRFATVFAARTRDHWEAHFADTDACVTPVLSMREAVGHPANTARHMFVRHNDVDQAAPAPRLSATPGAIEPSIAIDMDAAIARWS